MALSNSDARAIKAIIVLGSMVEEGHFGIYKKDIIPYINGLAGLYMARDADSRKIEALRANIKDASKRIAKLGYKSTIGMMMHVVLDVSDEFALKCSKQRRQAWDRLIAYADSNELKRHLAKRSDELALDQIDKAIAISEIIKEDIPYGTEYISANVGCRNGN